EPYTIEASMYDVTLLITSRRLSRVVPGTGSGVPVNGSNSERSNGIGLEPSGSLGSSIGMRKSPTAPVDSRLNSGPFRVRSVSWVIHWPHWKAQSVRCRSLGTLPFWAWITLLIERALSRLRGELVAVMIVSPNPSGNWAP